MTILERFKNLVENDSNPEAIIRFMSIENAKLMVLIGAGKIDEKYNEILDFYNFFMEHYEFKTRKARLENWGQEPLILRIGKMLASDVC